MTPKTQTVGDGAGNGTASANRPQPQAREAPLTNPTITQRAESIARIIDPDAINAGFDPDRGCVQNDIDARADEARRKAHEILALPPSDASASVGEGVTTAMVEAAKRYLRFGEAESETNIEMALAAALATLSAAPQTTAPEDGEAEESYQIGKRDGYEEAIQDLDLATGGDGEYVGRIGGETVDVPVMRQRIIDRLDAQTTAPQTEDEPFGVSGALNEVEALAYALWAHRCPGLLMYDDDTPLYEAAARAAFETLDGPALSVSPSLEGRLRDDLLYARNHLVRVQGWEDDTDDDEHSNWSVYQRTIDAIDAALSAPPLSLEVVEALRASEAALVASKQTMWLSAREQWTMADFKNWDLIQQIDGALTKVRSALSALQPMRFEGIPGPKSIADAACVAEATTLVPGEVKP